MSSFILDGWKSSKKPNWESSLEDASESVIRKTGLSREKLRQVMETMYEHRIIN